MKALIIIGAIALLIVILLLLWVRIRIIYDDTFQLRLSVGFLRFTLYPRREKPVNLKDYKIKRFRKTHGGVSKKMAKGKKKSTDEKVSPLSDMFGVFRRTLIKMVGELHDKLFTETFYLRMKVGGADAASAAITYGFISQGVAYVAEFVRMNTAVKRSDAFDIQVEPDFTSDEPAAELRVVFKTRVVYFLKLIIQTMINYMRLMARRDAEKEKRGGKIEKT